MITDTDAWKEMKKSSKNGTKQRIAQSLEDIIQDELKTLKDEKLREIYANKQDYIEEEIERRVDTIARYKHMNSIPSYSIVFTWEEARRIAEFFDKAFEDAKEEGCEDIDGEEGIKSTSTQQGEVITAYAYGQELIIREDGVVS